MKCQVCRIKETKANSIVCSENCNQIRLKIHRLSDTYTPTSGCAKCWGDLGGSCTDKCKYEFAIASKFVNELYELVRLTLKS
jgi:hypothetical protein